MMSVKRGMVKSVNGVTTAREIGRGISGHSAVSLRNGPLNVIAKKSHWF